MSEFVDQRVREAFMEFRDDVQVEITPPGPEAVRRVVGRRRRRVTAIVASGLAGVLIGAWALLGPAVSRAPVTSGPTTSTPTISYEQSVQAAFERLGYQSYQSEWMTVQDSPIWWGATVAGEAGVRTFRYPGSQPGSPITMTAACAGTGAITLRLQSADDSFNLDVSCGDDGGAEYTGLRTVIPDQAVEVTVRGDERVAPEGAFVVVMSDPRSLAAAAALGPPASGETDTSTGTTYDPYDDGAANRPVGPGRYHLALHCIGDAGRVLIRMSLADEQVTDETACPSDGGRLDLELSSSAAAGLEVAIAEWGSFGYAYRITRIEAPS